MNDTIQVQTAWLQSLANITENTEKALELCYLDPEVSQYVFRLIGAASSAKTILELNKKKDD